jgi:hypothetical protein
MLKISEERDLFRDVTIPIPPNTIWYWYWVNMLLVDKILSTGSWSTNFLSTQHFVDTTLRRRAFRRQDTSSTEHFVDRILRRQHISSTEHFVDRTLRRQHISSTDNLRVRMQWA